MCEVGRDIQYVRAVLAVFLGRFGLEMVSLTPDDTSDPLLPASICIDTVPEPLRLHQTSNLSGGQSREQVWTTGLRSRLPAILVPVYIYIYISTLFVYTYMYIHMY